MVANLHLQWTNQIFNLYLNGCWLKMSSWGRGLSSWGRRSEWRANSRPIHSPLPPPPPLSMYSLVLSLSALSSQFTLLPISSPRSPLPLNCWALPASILSLSPSAHTDWELGLSVANQTSKFASWCARFSVLSSSSPHPSSKSRDLQRPNPDNSEERAGPAKKLC